MLCHSGFRFPSRLPGTKANAFDSEGDGGKKTLEKIPEGATRRKFHEPGLATVFRARAEARGSPETLG